MYCSYVVNSPLTDDLASCPGSLSGTVFEDLDKDGALDLTDSLIPAYELNLYDANNNFISNTKTGNKGYYEFTNLELGTYIVKIVLVDPYNGDTTPLTQTVTVGKLTNTGNIDFGLIRIPPTPTATATASPTQAPTSTATPIPTAVPSESTGGQSGAAAVTLTATQPAPPRRHTLVSLSPSLAITQERCCFSWS